MGHWLRAQDCFLPVTLLPGHHAAMSRLRTNKEDPDKEVQSGVAS